MTTNFPFYHFHSDYDPSILHVAQRAVSPSNIIRIIEFKPFNIVIIYDNKSNPLTKNLEYLNTLCFNASELLSYRGRLISSFSNTAVGQGLKFLEE